MGNWLIDRTAAILERDDTRRGFLTKTALVGTALAVAPVSYVLRPQTAYATICSCNGSSCNCTDLCCDGYTEFCCTLTGSNSCPPGTVAAGWWKADNSGFCDVEGASKPRYYIDCNGGCNDGCGCGSSGVCSQGCSDSTCNCGNGDCNNRKSGCTGFRYGQCNNHIECVGRIVCRVVTCTPPWEWEESCTTASATDNYTRYHNRPCLHGLEVTSSLPGVVTGNQWTLREAGLDPVEHGFAFGEVDDLFIMGDWNGDGTRTPGVVRGAKFGPYGGKLTWMLRNSNSSGPPDIVLEFGEPGDQPVVGDWNGDGADSIGVLSPNGVWKLRVDRSTGPPDSEFVFGQSGDTALVGDWNGNGVDTIGVHRGTQFLLRNVNNAGPANHSFYYGREGDTPVAGDWNGDGVDTIGVFRDGHWLLKNAHAGGNSDVNFTFGGSGDAPVVWTVQ